jgi:hypothetical protein
MIDLTSRRVAGCRQGCKASEGASSLQIWRGRLAEFVGRLVDSLGIPGFVRPVLVHDQVTNTHLEIRPGILFTVVSIDGRDFYFRRLTGAFDGTGTASCEF